MNTLKTLVKLKIDPEVAGLYMPLSSSEIERIHQDIRLCIPSAPFPEWHGIVLDRLYEYQMYRSCGITVYSISYEYASREAMLEDICRKIVSRLPENNQYRTYLIGKQYRYHKTVYIKNPDSWGEGSMNSAMLRQKYGVNTNPAMFSLIEQYNVSSTTLNTYAKYSESIDYIKETLPGFAYMILSNELNISAKISAELRECSKQELTKIFDYIINNKITRLKTAIVLKYHKPMPSPTPNKESLPKIKQMPKYDPDAEVSILSLTMPSWAEQIKRVNDNSNMSHISSKARKKLLAEIDHLESSINEIKNSLKEKHKHGN